MWNLGVIFLVLSVISLVYALLHLGLLRTALPIHPEARFALNGALGFVIFGLNGMVILRRVRRHQRSQ